MEFHPLAQPEEIPVREREDAMGAYLMMFASVAVGLPLPILNLIAAVIYYSIHTKKSRFVRFHSLHSLISQLPISLLNGVAFGWTVKVLFSGSEPWDERSWVAYVGFVVVANLAYFVFSIVGAVRARAGRMYYFLLFGPIAYNAIYKVKPGEEHGQQQEYSNEPPSF